jgi:signal transduction histidine kinase
VIYQRRYVGMHRTYAQRLLQAQEEERAWVAREVHDDALQRIALIRRECDAVRRSAPSLNAEQLGRLEGVRGELADLTAFLRSVAHRLHPTLIDKGGLRAALAGLPDDVQKAYGLQVEARLPEGPIPLAPERALAVYRIAQEALRNAAMHAGVTTAILECRRTVGAFELTVSDRGKGFDLRANGAGRVRGGAGEGEARGLGLIGMRERAHLAGGLIAVTSRPGEGTVVRAWFPDLQVDAR